MKNALNNQVGMLGDMFLWLVANLKQGVIYFIKQALPPNISAGSVPQSESATEIWSGRVWRSRAIRLTPYRESDTEGGTGSLPTTK